MLQRHYNYVSEKVMSEPETDIQPRYYTVNIMRLCNYSDLPDLSSISKIMEAGKISVGCKFSLVLRIPIELGKSALEFATSYFASSIN